MRSLMQLPVYNQRQEGKGDHGYYAYQRNYHPDKVEFFAVSEHNWGVWCSI